MLVAVASGKGGTGKTSVAVSLSLVAAEENGSVVLADCDVEEPNAYILLKPVIEEKEEVSVLVPQVNEERCTNCGECAKACRFNALAVLPSSIAFFENLCHSCGVCALVCPEGAIAEQERVIGVMERGRAGGVEFIGGRLNTGEARATPLIKSIKTRLPGDGKDVVIDVSPGTSCPMVEAVRGVDIVLLVTEPTPFGLNDLKLSVETLRRLGVPFVVFINRSDIGSGIEEWSASEGIDVLASVPFDRSVAEGYSRGEPPVAVSDEWKRRFIRLWHDLKESI